MRTEAGETMTIAFQQANPASGEACLAEGDLLLFREDALCGRRREEAHAHVNQCPVCQERLDQLEHLLASEWDREDPGVAGSTQRVVARLKNLPSEGRVEGRHAPSSENDPWKSIRDARDLIFPDHSPEFKGWLQSLGQAAEGGMAAVFHCRDLERGRDVAVKILRHRYAGNEEVAKQFRREARIQATMDQPGVAEVYAAGELADGRLYTVMEYRPGTTLANELRTRPRLAGLFNVYREVCSVVAAAHQRGIVHRDIKPANIQIGPCGEVTLLDWGLADHGSVREKVDAFATDSPFPKIPDLDCMVVGTPGYVAPEQARGELGSAASDVYALGVIMAEILAGDSVRCPRCFLTDEGEIRKVTDQIVKAVRESGARPALVDLVARCLAVAPDKRPQNAAELAAELVGLQRYDTPERHHGRPPTFFRPNTRLLNLSAADLLQLPG